MVATVVIGAQWGDEGKGKVVDLLGKDHPTVVRFHGGNNAGHTLVVNGKKHVLHLLPSGIIRSGTTNIVGPGVVCDLPVLVAELQIAAEHNSSMYLDEHAAVILPHHIQIDQLREQRAGKVGTTGRGIGPCYEDTVARRGVKLRDLKNEERLRKTLTRGDYYGERCALVRHLGDSFIPLHDLVGWCLSFQEKIVPYLADTRALIAEKMTAGETILFEGAQGVLLDVMQGALPYVTSSICTVAGVSSTFGLYAFERVIGVAKAYLTRVGEGPFPTELSPDASERLRTAGGEYGATTGRPRRCGWLDLVALRYAIRMGGITELFLTKLDVLSGYGMIPVCTQYMQGGTSLSTETTLTCPILEQITPRYAELPGWSEDITNCRVEADLPKNAREYIAFIEKETQTPITALSVGPERSQIIFRT